MADSTPHMVYRSDTNKIIGGVAGGLGEYFALDPVIFRLLFVILSFAGGAGFFLYGICWILIPSRKNARSNFEESVKANAEDIAHEFQRGWDRSNGQVTAGIWLIVIGILFLLANLGFFSFNLLSKLWPLFLILVGVQIFISSARR